MDYKLNNKYDVLIIGGGIAGISASLELSKNDFSSIIIEKSSTLGGYSLEFCCKASESCNSCSACLVSKYIKDMGKTTNVVYIVDSVVNDVLKDQGRFNVKVTKNPRYINIDKCNACGECSKVCPAGQDVILLKNPQALPLAYHINTSKCIHFKGENCRKCESVCPNKAIDLDEKLKEINYEVNAIIVAIGFKPIDASQKSNYHLNKYQNVITGLDAEKMIRERGFLYKESDATPPGKIAFIQCVGSRDTTRGKGYCSRVCCGYSMRISRMLEHLDPKLDISIFYMDLQNFGRNFSEFYKESRRKMKFIRSMPADISEDESGLLNLRFEDVDSNRIIESSFDMLILSIGMQPSEDTEFISKLMDLSMDKNGFLKSVDFTDTTKTEKDGIFLAGSCQGPKDINESITHGTNAASEVLSYLMKNLKLTNY